MGRSPGGALPEAVAAGVCWTLVACMALGAVNIPIWRAPETVERSVKKTFKKYRYASGRSRERHVAVTPMIRHSSIQMHSDIPVAFLYYCTMLTTCLKKNYYLFLK